MGSGPQRNTFAAVIVSALLAWSCPNRAGAQEAIHTDSTAVPSVGRVAVRQAVQVLDFGDDPTPFGRVVQEWRAVTTVEYGLRPDLTLAAYLPVVYRETHFTGALPAGARTRHDGPHPVPGEPGAPALPFAGDHAWADLALDDFTLTAKYRLYRNDFGPIDTARLAVVIGAELPSGAEPFSSDSVDPVLGAVFTYIEGRHGFNADLLWKFNTSSDDHHPGGAVRAGEGADDVLFYDTAYLFRVAPERFTAHTSGAWYAVLEANGAYETNGDNELLIAPGLLYEARGFAIEASVQIPVWQDLDCRPETEFTITLGIRFLF